MSSRLKAALSLESPALSGAFWLAVCGYVALFWVARFPPCIDYPQHLAVAATLSRMASPDAPEHARYVFEPLTYNGGFHVSVALLAKLMPAEIAGKLVLSLVPLLTGAALLAVLRLAGRPRWYAFALLPFCYSHAVGWGFVNYSLAAPFAILTLTWFVRFFDGERALGWRIALAGLVLGYTHVLATLCLYISIAVVALARSTPASEGGAAWLRRRLIAALPTLPGALWCMLVYRAHSRAPNIYWEPEKDGTDVPAWTKLRDVLDISVGNLHDRGAELALALGLAIVLAVWLARYLYEPASDSPEQPPARTFWALGITWLVLYLVVPQIIMSTWFIFERLPLWWMTFLVAAAPVPGARLARALSAAAAAVALGGSANAAASAASVPGEDDADRVLDAVPEGANLTPLIFGQDPERGVRRSIWVHAGAYHVARRRGELAYNFLRYASIPLRYREEVEASVMPSGVEWYPKLFDYRSDYARAYPWVFVRTPDSAPNRDPRERIYAFDAERVRVAAHSGRFWLLDARGLYQPAHAHAPEPAPAHAHAHTHAPASAHAPAHTPEIFRHATR